MLQKIRTYGLLIRASILSHMEHRASFFMQIMSYCFSSVVDIIGIWILFDRFHMIKGWSFSEVSVLYGVIHIGFSCAETFSRGFDHLSTLVRKGSFDRILLRPLQSVFQVLCHDVQFMRLGRAIQGLFVLVWGASTLGISFLSFQSFVLFLATIGVFLFFLGLFVLQGALVFWTQETLELMHIVTFGGVESGQFPMSIYKDWFRRFFTYIVPLACVAYYPVAVLLHIEKLPLLFAALFPLVGAFFFSLSCLVWQRALKRYASSGC